jgi:hypothetical protein
VTANPSPDGGGSEALGATDGLAVGARDGSGLDEGRATADASTVAVGSAVGSVAPPQAVSSRDVTTRRRVEDRSMGLPVRWCVKRSRRVRRAE